MDLQMNDGNIMDRLKSLKRCLERYELTTIISCALTRKGKTVAKNKEIRAE